MKLFFLIFALSIFNQLGNLQLVSATAESTT